jgi:protein-S-isoprenylcysteine O-methyltransferase Ste14
METADMNVRQRMLALRPPRIGMTLGAAAIAVHAIVPRSTLPSFAAAAALSAGLGFAIMIRAWWLFRRAGTAICPTERPTTLVTHDVFALTRNPMYLGMIMMLAAPAFLFGSIPFYVAAAVFALFLDRVFCPYEESKLEAGFDAAYARYRSRVRRWL